MSERRVAVYPASFDPITNGHLDLIGRAARLFDEVIVAVATNVTKQPLFTLEERIEMIESATRDIPNVRIDSMSGLTVDYARERGSLILIRGLRALADFEYEFQLAVMNRRLAPEVDTMFLMTAEENFYVSSSLVKEVASLGGDVSGLVPDSVRRALERRYRSGGSAA